MTFEEARQIADDYKAGKQTPGYTVTLNHDVWEIVDDAAGEVIKSNGRVWDRWSFKPPSFDLERWAREHPPKFLPDDQMTQAELDRINILDSQGEDTNPYLVFHIGDETRIEYANTGHGWRARPLSMVWHEYQTIPTGKPVPRGDGLL